nr:KilA-N domain-containing protein [Pseudodesulfovibrio senegalensis]
MRFDGELVNLTTLWKAQGSDHSKRPNNWLVLPSTVEFIETLKSKSQNILLLKSVKGRYGGTFGHWQIALALTSINQLSGSVRWILPTSSMRW